MKKRREKKSEEKKDSKHVCLTLVCARYVIMGASEEEDEKKRKMQGVRVSILIALTRPFFSLSPIAFALTITRLTKMFSSPSIKTFLLLVFNAITHH